MTPRPQANRIALCGAPLIAIGIGFWLSGLDIRLHDPLRLSAGAALVPVALFLTHLGGFAVMGPFALLIVIVLLLRGRKRDALWLFATIASGRLIVEGVKFAVTRPRPPIADHLQYVTSWSFPSSHTAGTTLTCLALAWASGWRGAPAIAIVFAGLIGWSRLALGVHWPGDVLAAWGLGLVWIGLAIRFTPARAERVAPIPPGGETLHADEGSTEPHR